MGKWLVNISEFADIAALIASVRQKQLQRQMSLLEKTEQIEVKVRQLGSKLDQLEEQNKGLRQENEQLKAERDRQSGTLAALQDKLERSQQTLTQREEGNEEPGDDLRQQIDHYLREIDKCIEWLSRQ